MTANILEQVGRQSPFVPTTPKHLLAFKIARKLADIETLSHYLVLSEHFPKELMLKAYISALSSDTPGKSFFAFFNH